MVLVFNGCVLATPGTKDITVHTLFYQMQLAKAGA